MTLDLVDMHVHTTASDGTVSPSLAVSMAAMEGLRAIAITDQDTMAGIEEAGEAGAMMNVTIIPGIEISSRYKDGTEVDILGYFLNTEARELAEYEQYVQKSLQERNERTIEKLNRKGFKITLESIEAENPDGGVGLTHIAQAIVKLGGASSVDEAFRRYLGEGRSCAVTQRLISMEDAVKLVRKCGGVGVLAHPFQYGFSRKKLEELVADAKRAGAKGIEIYYTGYTDKDRGSLFDLAEKYELLPTGGSGFRGENSPGIRIGAGDGNLRVPAYMLMMLAASQYR